MHLDGYGLFVSDMGKMIRFYRDVLGFEIKEAEDTDNVYLQKDEKSPIEYVTVEQIRQELDADRP